jgi:hypothetical protein
MHFPEDGHMSGRNMYRYTVCIKFTFIQLHAFYGFDIISMHSYGLFKIPFVPVVFFDEPPTS